MARNEDQLELQEQHILKEDNAPQQLQATVLKVKFMGTTRRSRVTALDLSSLDALKSKVNKIFKSQIKDPQLILKYRDSSRDLITIGADDEVAEFGAHAFNGVLTLEVISPAIKAKRNRWFFLATLFLCMISWHISRRLFVPLLLIGALALFLLSFEGFVDRICTSICEMQHCGRSRNQKPSIQALPKQEHDNNVQQQQQPQQQEAHNAPLSFQDKLTRLNEMGFANREQNIKALVGTQGDLTESIKLLLSH